MITSRVTLDGDEFTLKVSDNFCLARSRSFHEVVSIDGGPEHERPYLEEFERWPDTGWESFGSSFYGVSVSLRHKELDASILSYLNEHFPDPEHNSASS